MNPGHLPYTPPLSTSQDGDTFKSPKFSNPDVEKMWNSSRYTIYIILEKSIEMYKDLQCIFLGNVWTLFGINCTTDILPWGQL